MADGESRLFARPFPFLLLQIPWSFYLSEEAIAKTGPAGAGRCYLTAMGELFYPGKECAAFLGIMHEGEIKCVPGRCYQSTMGTGGGAMLGRPGSMPAAASPLRALLRPLTETGGDQTRD